LITIKIKELKTALMLSLATVLSVHSTTGFAQDSDTRESIFISPYTKHYGYNPDHKHVWLVGYEQQLSNKSLRGAAFFSNSFGQESVYIFPWGGRYDDVFGVNGLHVKWTAGLMYGYKAPYEDKVPLNYKGFSLAVIPSVGYQITKQWSVDALFLGNAALMLGTSYRFR
jgi:hypothetical protein